MAQNLGEVVKPNVIIDPISHGHFDSAYGSVASLSSGNVRKSKTRDPGLLVQCIFHIFLLQTFPIVSIGPRFTLSLVSEELRRTFD